MDLEALSATLPAGWRAMLDPSSNQIYFGNLSTKVGLQQHFTSVQSANAWRVHHVHGSRTAGEACKRSNPGACQ